MQTGLAGETSNDASFYGAGDAWAYVLCGFGTNCAISGGKPSVERYDLLRREALELALYTFKYNHSIQSVLAYMPPAKAANASGQATPSLIFLRRGDVKQALDQPLKTTLLPPKTNLKPGQMTAAELRARSQPDRLAGLQLQLPAARGRHGDRRARPDQGLTRSAETRAALERAKARLDRLSLYPRPVRIDHVHVVVWPWFFRLPWFNRFWGYAAHYLIILRAPVGEVGDDLVTHELCHVWQMQHKPIAMPLSYLRGYENNPHELEARRAVEATR